METKDYQKFKFLKENRGIKIATVKKIEQSIKDFGIIPGRPVLVDESFNIVDGQHRFEAMKNLGIPVNYEVIKGDVISKTMALNSSQSQWLLIDYIKSYAAQNVDCYRKFLKFEEKYKFGVTASMYIFFSKETKTHTIRKGVVLDINPEADLVAEYILSLNEVSFFKTKDFIRAVVSLHRKASINQLLVIQSNILRVPRCATITEYVTAFENILNYRKRGNNIIKL